MNHDWQPHEVEITSSQVLTVDLCSQCGCVRYEKEIFKNEELFWHARVAWTGMAGTEYATNDCAAELIRAVLEI